MYGKRLATKEEILKLITEYDIFRYYIFSFKELNRAFCSELTKDKNPSCIVYLYNNKLTYKDYRETERLDCFSYIMKKYNLSFYESLDLINRDFNLGLIPNTQKQFIHSLIEKEILLYGDNYLKDTPIERKEIKVELINWNGGIHKRYWYDRYGISVKDLVKFDIFPIKSFQIHSENSFNHFIASYLAFGYWFGYSDGLQTWKIYQPYEDKKRKWFSNTHIDTLQGYKQLKFQSDTLIITKSLKDVVVLDKLKYDSVAPNSESSMIDSNLMFELKDKYKRIVLLYDNDETGIKGSKRISSLYDIETLFLPQNTEKDVSDYVSKYGYDNLSNELKNLLNV